MQSKRAKHEFPLFPQASRITHATDDVWKKFWQTVNTFTKTLRHGPSCSYQFNKREEWKILLMNFLLRLRDSFQVGVIEPNKIVWNIPRELRLLLLELMHKSLQSLNSWLPFTKSSAPGFSNTPRYIRTLDVPHKRTQTLASTWKSSVDWFMLMECI